MQLIGSVGSFLLSLSIIIWWDINIITLKDNTKQKTQIFKLILY